MKDPTQRFSDRVENYVRYRPRYPSELLTFFSSELRVNRDSVVADIGSGTGFLSELLLQSGCRVYGIEPNEEMRRAGESAFEKYSNFVSIAGSAENTQLPDRSVDFIMAAQAFHWFDPARSRLEFLRILKPGGVVVLIWNERKVDNPFLVEYENLILAYGIDYKEVDHRRIDAAALTNFFGHSNFLERTFLNLQHLDYEGLRGRLLSASYIPGPGQPGHDPMIKELQRLFDLHQRDGQVTIEYITRVYYGDLKQRVRLVCEEQSGAPVPCEQAPAYDGTVP